MNRIFGGASGASLENGFPMLKTKRTRAMQLSAGVLTYKTREQEREKFIVSTSDCLAYHCVVSWRVQSPSFVPVPGHVGIAPRTAILPT